MLVLFAPVQSRNVRFPGFLQGDLRRHGIWVRSCFCFWVFVLQVLEAVGRKNFVDICPGSGQDAGAHSGRENATSDFRRAPFGSHRFPSLAASLRKLDLCFESAPPRKKRWAGGTMANLSS